jgi:hypothetical protein
VQPSTAVVPESFEGIVMSNINPAQIDRRLDAIRTKFAGPVLRLWHPRRVTADYFDESVAA